MVGTECFAINQFVMVVNMVRAILQENVFVILDGAEKIVINVWIIRNVSWVDALIRHSNVSALTVTMVLSVRTQFVAMVVIQNMVNVFIQKNVGVSLDGKALIVQNAFRIGTVSMVFVTSLMNANVLMDFMAMIAIQR